jgi:phospholipase D1/2
MGQLSGGSRWRVAGWALLILAAIAALYLALDEVFDREDMERLVERLRSVGNRWWAPAALIGAFVVINLVGLPGTPLTLAAGAVWGWLVGASWVMAAVMIGTAVPYYLARKGAPRLKRRLEERFDGMHERIAKEGLTTLLVMRLTHLIPYAVLSYAAGLAGLRPRDFFVATFFGTLPGVLIYTYLADAILAGLVSPEETGERILLAGFLLAALAVATRVMARRARR